MAAVVRGLGGPSGYGEISVPRSDDASVRQDWSAVFEGGLNVFGTRYDPTEVWVNTNGTISFGQAFAAFPTVANAAPPIDLIAAFWSDVDTRLRGEGLESGRIHVDVDPAADRVIVTWAEVGTYRRDTSEVNTFQVILQDKGAGDFDIILRYEDIGWTQGSADTDAGARAGLFGPLLPRDVSLTTGDLADLDIAAGNAGTGVWRFEVRDGAVNGMEPSFGLNLIGTAGADTLRGAEHGDILKGLDGDDALVGGDGENTLFGGNGSDRIFGGNDDDLIFGGDDSRDLRDVIYGGDGNDTVDAGYGNDEVYLGAGNDSALGGFGSDTLIGDGGNDTLTGGPLSDVLFGADGDDFLNGGFGHDRLNGGRGADVFYHLGIHDHGSDWIQDYASAEGDVMQFGQSARPSDFQINYAETPDAGVAGVAETFIIYKPTGQIIWALVDGAAQDHLIVEIGGTDYDLLA